ncbi:MAG TPA: TolC family protein [Bacteroidales bacterium]|nr:TolC family protein [Bacteroidales bacterium]
MRSLITIFILMLFSGGLKVSAQQENIWTLDDCITYALERNITIRKNEVSNRRNELYAEQARAQRFPSLNASINQNFNWTNSNSGSATGFSGSNGSNYSLNSGVTIFNASRLSNQIRQADLDIESGKYQLETAKESISLSILDAYLQILYAEEQVNNSRKQIEATQGQLKLAVERLQLKVISEADYAQVKAQIASEKLTLANSESQLAISRVNLMQLMELPVTDSFNISHPDLSGSLNQNRLPDVSSVYETSLAIKPQIKNASVNKEIAALDEKIARAGFYPTLSASTGIGSAYSSRTDDAYFSQINDGINPSLGFSLAIPIYQKKQAKTNVAVAKLGYQDAELSEINTMNELRKNIEQACQDVISAQTEYEASLESFNSTLESSRLSDEKFIQGMINSVDYMVSKTNLIVAESRLLQSKFNLIFSYKVLDFYSGIPLTI